MERFDGSKECGRCGGKAHDVIDRKPRTMRIECAYCGMIDCVAATPQRHAAGKSGGIVLKHGRHAGKTLAAVAAEPNGKEYLEALSASSPALRDPIVEVLSAPP